LKFVFVGVYSDVWIQCNICLKWYHCFCVNVPECEINEIDQFHCTNCAPKCGPSIMKPIRNRHRYDRTQAADGLPIQVGTGVFIEELTKRKFPIFDQVHVLDGESVNFDYLATYGFKLPILVNKMAGLNLKIPQHFTLDYLLEKLDDDYMLEVIDVHYQQTTKMKLVDLVAAMKDTENRPAILNCISLELSSTSLSRQVEPPSIVRRISWVENCWGLDDASRPQVSKYCLISMKHSYTDFHIDFSGTSVWYHVLKGKKLFYFIEPTQENLKKYEEWMNKENYTEIFFPDMIQSKCSAFLLNAGQTMFIPTGWIHAVYTPEDSIVFGGNFLHAFNIPLQMDIFELEDRVGTTDKFKFPYFEYTHWFAQQHTMKLIKALAKKIPKYSRKNLGLVSVVKGTKLYIKYLKKWLLTAKQNAATATEGSFLIPGDFNCEKAIGELQQAVEQFRHIDRPPKDKSKESVPKNEVPSYSIFKKAFEALPSKPPVSSPAATVSVKPIATIQLPQLQSFLQKLTDQPESNAIDLKPRIKKRVNPDGDHLNDSESNGRQETFNKSFKQSPTATTKSNSSLPAVYFASNLSNFKIPKRKREDSSDQSDASDFEGSSLRQTTPGSSPKQRLNSLQLTSRSNLMPFFPRSNELISFMQPDFTEKPVTPSTTDGAKDELLDQSCNTSSTLSSDTSSTSPERSTSNLPKNGDTKTDSDAWPSIDVYFGNSIYSH
jgi:lysine-specific demethylase PHF8